MAVVLASGLPAVAWATMFRCVFGRTTKSWPTTACVMRGASDVLMPESAWAVDAGDCASNAPGAMESAAAMDALNRKFRCFMMKPQKKDRSKGKGDVSASLRSRGGCVNKRPPGDQQIGGIHRTQARRETPARTGVIGLVGRVVAGG